MSIQNRKKEHVELSVKQDVNYQKSAGFDRYDFVHNALPELSLDETDTTCRLLGRDFAFPLFISSMTGGYTEAGAVNAIIAKFCEEHNLPFGVGSQRAMLEDHGQAATFSVVREHAPTAFIAANIGGAQLTGGLPKRDVELLIESIRADAVIVHLNPLQELMQPEGDVHFKGILEGIERLLNMTDMPVIVKETGAGISAAVSKKLIHAGVKVIDVAGAGGTSWAKVENLRERQKNARHLFDDWGIPTVDCVIENAGLKTSHSFELIASGGIRSSFDIIKSIALGADFTATAQPVIKAVVSGGYDELEAWYGQWVQEARIALTLLGCKTFADLNAHHLRKV